MTVRIREGRHFARFWDLVRLTFLTGFFGRPTFRVTFSEDAFFYNEPDHYVGAYNKLLGRNCGLTPYSRWGSVRLGWRTRSDGALHAIEMVRFTEDRHGFHTQSLGHVRSGESFEYTVEHWGIPCWTFFGGRYPAPENFRIDVVRVS